MIPIDAKFLTHSGTLHWGDPDVGLEQVYINQLVNKIDDNLFHVVLGEIWGDHGQWFFDKCRDSLSDHEKILLEYSETCDFRISNGIIEVKESNFGQDRNISRFGTTYIDMHNLKYYCDKYESCYRNQRDENFTVFCFHVD